MRSTARSHRRWRQAGSLASALRLAAGLSFAASTLLGQQPPEPAEPRACTAITTDAERLACYDHAFARGLASAEAMPTPAAAPPPLERSLLDRRWELLPASKLGTFGMRAYRPVYILPWVGASDVNQLPSSPSPGHTVDRSENLDASELVFQVSLKTKAWQGVFGEIGDLWLAYTQSSRLQLYNSARSRPFRETDYEPEILLVFATDFHLLGWRGHLLSVGINHESNGRDEPRSRSWNRITASIGLERESWTLTLRPWWRVPESASQDDNPDIEDYIGRADLLLVRHAGHHELTALLRHTLAGGERSRSAVQLDWAFPIRGNLRGHVQLFDGYGDSLIDYNFRSTRLGLGISLLEWY